MCCAVLCGVVCFVFFGASDSDLGFWLVLLLYCVLEPEEVFSSIAFDAMDKLPCVDLLAGDTVYFKPEEVFFSMPRGVLLVSGFDASYSAFG